MKVWLKRTAFGLIPDNEESAQQLAKIKPDTTIECEVVLRKARSLAFHRRYWALLKLLSENVERVNIATTELDEWWMVINDVQDMHEAMKYLTGFYDRQVFRYKEKTLIALKTRSIAFDAMDAEQFALYWKKVTDAVFQRVLPGVDSFALEEEVARLAS